MRGFDILIIEAMCADCPGISNNSLTISEIASGVELLMSIPNAELISMMIDFSKNTSKMNKFYQSMVKPIKNLAGMFVAKKSPHTKITI